MAAGETDERIVMAGPTVRTPRGETERASLRRFPTPWNSLMTFSGLAALGRWLPAFRGVDACQALPGERHGDLLAETGWSAPRPLA